MTISQQTKDLAQLYWRRRWAMFFMNLVAGIFAAPLLYWGCIFMPVVLYAAHDAPILLGLNVLSSIGCGTLLMLAALGLGGCFSAMRKILAGEDKALVGDIWRGFRRCAGTSLLAGAVTGISMAAAQTGLVGLHAVAVPGILRAGLSALLALQLFMAVSLGLLTLTRPDALQHRPIMAMAAAGRIIAAHPVRYAGLCAATLPLLILLFIWRAPLPTLVGFLLVELLLLAPGIMLWQSQESGIRNQEPGHKKFGLMAVFGSFFSLDVAAILLPLFLRREFPARAFMATLRQTMDFIARQTLLEARNGTLREMLASSGVWPLLLVTLLGCVGCTLAAYACACYSFRLRGLAFAGAAVLQAFPILSSYAGLVLLLRNLRLGSPWMLGVAWMALYFFILLMLYRKFRRLLPGLKKNKEAYPGVRLFFYFALPRARYWIYALAAISTLGCWNDALAPFWYMRELGAFSLAGFIWGNTGTWERPLYPAIFLALLGVGILACKLSSRLTIPRDYDKIK